MNKDLIKLRCKKEANKRWKQSQVTQEHAQTDRVRKPSWSESGKEREGQQGFLWVYQKQKEAKEKCEPAADGARDLVAKDMEEPKVLNASFASAFTRKESQKKEETFFKVRVIEHWDRLLRELVKSPTLEMILKTWPGTILSNLL